jgi:hypothetical protein
MDSREKSLDAPLRLLDEECGCSLTRRRRIGGRSVAPQRAPADPITLSPLLLGHPPKRRPIGTRRKDVGR